MVRIQYGNKTINKQFQIPCLQDMPKRNASNHNIVLDPTVTIRSWVLPVNPGRGRCPHEGRVTAMGSAVKLRRVRVRGDQSGKRASTCGRQHTKCYAELLGPSVEKLTARDSVSRERFYAAGRPTVEALRLRGGCTSSSLRDREGEESRTARSGALVADLLLRFLCKQWSFRRDWC